MCRLLQISLGILCGAIGLYGFLWLTYWVTPSELYLLGDVPQLTVMVGTVVIVGYLGSRLFLSMGKRCRASYYMSWPMAIMSLVAASLALYLSSISSAMFQEAPVLGEAWKVELVRSAAVGWQIYWGMMAVMFLSMPLFAKRWNLRSF